jgi:hypothetical protein
MDNKQLLILLRKYMRQLEEALDIARKLMPENAERLEETRWTVKDQETSDFEGVMSLSGQTSPVGEFKALQPIVYCLEDLKEDIATLTEEPFWRKK